MQLTIQGAKTSSLTASPVQVVKVIGYACVVLGIQRFYLDSIYALVCIIPLLLALMLPRKEVPLRNSLLLLALYLSVDQGAGIYNETPAALRYVIYLSILVDILSRLKISLKLLGVYSLLISMWIVLTLLNPEYVQLQALYRDLIVVFLFGLVVATDRQAVDAYRLDLNFLKKSLLIVLGVEIFQIATVYNYDAYGYLSYDSGKFLLALPAISYLVVGKPVKAVAILLLTVFVMLLYGTRMIPIAFFVAIILYILARVFSGNKSMLSVLTMLILAAIVLGVNIVSFEEFKLIGTLIRASTADTLSVFLSLLDPVRFGELVLFFERPILEILLGSGMGVGIRDEISALSFVSIHQTAFSIQEIRTGIFYGFHDVWTDIGLRFGLIFIGAIYFVLTKSIVVCTKNAVLSSMVLFIAVTCAFFSIAGLLICALLALDWRYNRFAEPLPGRPIKT